MGRRSGPNVVTNIVLHAFDRNRASVIQPIISLYPDKIHVIP